MKYWWGNSYLIILYQWGRSTPATRSGGLLDAEGANRCIQQKYIQHIMPDTYFIGPREFFPWVYAYMLFLDLNVLNIKI